MVSRAQVLAVGLKPSYLARMVRHRQWVPLLTGVYLDHTGVPTWEQRAWAGVLRYAPAALCADSAMRAAIGRAWQPDAAPIRLMVAADRSLDGSSGYRVVRARHFGEAVMTNTSPPRQRLEEAVLDVALSKQTELGAVHVVADACRSRATQAERLIGALDRRSRAPRRDWLRGVLVDVRDGTCSVLEHGYLERVVRPHGLPVGLRQVADAATTGKVYRDVDLAPLLALVEIDGRLVHESSTQRDRDLDRDLDAVVDSDRPTVRLGWGQVFGRPCVTAQRLATWFTRLGWDGEPTRCPECPAVSERAA